MNTLKEQLMQWIDEDREQIIGFLCDFVRAKSPNPPGDTTRAAAHVASFLEAHQLPFRVIAPQPTMPNIIGSFAGPMPGRHLVLNGHMDVFPADEQNEHWTHGPWSGAIADGKIYGREADAIPRNWRRAQRRASCRRVGSGSWRGRSRTESG